MSGDAEALADSISGCLSNVTDLPDWMRVQALGRDTRPLLLLASEAVLASDWLAAYVAAERDRAVTEAGAKALEDQADALDAACITGLETTRPDIVARWLRRRAAALRAALPAEPTTDGAP